MIDRKSNYKDTSIPTAIFDFPEGMSDLMMVIDVSVFRCP